MTTHIFHEDSHTHGLCDDCPRCQEHAEYPAASLDTENINRLLNGHCFSELDRIAADKLQVALLASELSP